MDLQADANRRAAHASRPPFVVERSERSVLILRDSLVSSVSLPPPPLPALPPYAGGAEPTQIIALADLIKPAEQPIRPAEQPSSSLVQILPDTVAVELGDRTFTTKATSPALQYACSSHGGPEWLQREKSNEDFAFAVELRDAGGVPWICAGVADGVGNSTWCERGAMHAAATFIDIISELLQEGHDLFSRIEDEQFRVTRLAHRFNRIMQSRLDRDEQCIVEQRLRHGSWDPSTYEQYFFDHAQAAQHRQGWFQSTLLATALGPAGGFALFLGDGFARVGRRDSSGTWGRRPVDTQPADERGSPELLVSRYLTDLEVAMAVRRIPPQGAVELELLVSTDGVSKTPDSGIELVELASALDCTEFLESLASRPQGYVETDNLSVAFARYQVAP